MDQLTSPGPDWNPVYYHPRRRRRHRLRPHRDRHQLARAICAAVRAHWAISRPSATIICSGSTTCRGIIGWPTAATVWDELVIRYTDGVARVGGMRRTWDALAPAVDAERHAEVAAFLAIQEDEATLVARRLDRLFPEPVAPAAARTGSRRRRARSRLLSGDPDAACAGDTGEGQCFWPLPGWIDAPNKIIRSGTPACAVRTIGWNAR